MQKTEAIIFDLGGVILNIDYNLTRTAFEKLGIQNFDEMYSQSGADKLFQKLETGHITEQNFYVEINKRTGVQLSSKEINTAWNSMLLNFREESLRFLDKLKSKYRLFLLSNTNHIHLKKFTKIYNEVKREKPFINFFETAYFSCEIGLRKPDKECYDWVLKQEDLIPGNTIFIDDSHQNVEAAKLSGMQGILLEQGSYIENLKL